MKIIRHSLNDTSNTPKFIKSKGLKDVEYDPIEEIVILLSYGLNNEDLGSLIYGTELFLNLVANSK